jgi:pimeloyl-ACP methyl ester carboxylesterase
MKALRFALTALGLVFIVSQAAAQPIRDTLWIRMDDGVRLDCTRFTPQGLPPPGGFPGIVFVHGLGGSKTSTEGQARTYADSAYLTLAYSVRGQGSSEGLSPSSLLPPFPGMRPSGSAFTTSQGGRSGPTGETGWGRGWRRGSTSCGPRSGRPSPCGS